MKARSNSRELSPMERLLFASLQRKPITSTELIKVAYRGRRKPLNAGKSVLTVLRSLQRKRREVKSSLRAGPRPITFWIQ